MLVGLTTPHSDLKKMPRKPLKLSLNTDMGFRCPPDQSLGKLYALEARPCSLQSEVRQAETERNSTMLLQSEVRKAKRERFNTAAAV